MKLILHVKSGICNRINMIGMYRSYFKGIKLPMYIHWGYDNHCPYSYSELYDKSQEESLGYKVSTHLNDIYTPGEDIVFGDKFPWTGGPEDYIPLPTALMHETTRALLPKLKQLGDWDSLKAGPLYNYDKNHTIVGKMNYRQLEAVRLTRQLRLSDQAQHSVDITLESLPTKFNAIHIRSTDFTSKISPEENSQSIADNIKFIDKSTLPVYLATDCKETYNIYKSKYKDKVLNFSSFDDTKHKDQFLKTRKSTGSDCMVDLYVCAKSEMYRGTSLSTFSDYIYYLRGEVPSRFK